MWENPTAISQSLADMAKAMGCDWIGAVLVEPEPGCQLNDCHNNVISHCARHGGEQVIGYYFIQGFGTIQAIKHSVWKKDSSLFDITPYADGREYTIFGTSAQTDSDYTISNCYIHSLDKYLEKQETEYMYYVYQLVDPRNSQPFYVGKGSRNRAKIHLTNCESDRNPYKENKIAAIRQDGFEPIIEYVAENIIDESLAYDIEASVISRYGRKGYETGGILTNVCPDNRPPNHKGKTYEEIYGPERAKQQRELRSKLQKQRGGYGPKKHSSETRKKFSILNTGERNPMYGKQHRDDSKKKIGDANRKYVGKLNKKSKQYKLTSPEGHETVLWGSEAAKYCQENNLSYSTLKMQIQKGWGIPKKGKTKGWKFEEVKPKT